MLLIPTAGFWHLFAWGIWPRERVSLRVQRGQGTRSQCPREGGELTGKHPSFLTLSGTIQSCAPNNLSCGPQQQGLAAY